MTTTTDVIYCAPEVKDLCRRRPAEGTTVVRKLVDRTRSQYRVEVIAKGVAHVEHGDDGNVIGHVRTSQDGWTVSALYCGRTIDLGTFATHGAAIAQLGWFYGHRVSSYEVRTPLERDGHGSINTDADRTTTVGRWHTV